MTFYWLSAATMTLSSFAMVVLGVSTLLGFFSPALVRWAERYPPAIRASRLLGLRLLPAACGLLWSLGIALPIFLWFEPIDSGETLARTLIVGGLAGAALLARGGWRAIAAWRGTRLLSQDWHARGRRLAGFDTSMPVFAIDEVFPIVAVIGFVRPALFIAERVLDECTTDEVRAMVLHECAHVTQRDNVKRFLVRACPDPLARGGALDVAWGHAAEAAADAHAAAGDAGFALELAQALVRVARLAPRAGALEGASAFYLGGSIESRVRQLLHPSDRLPDPTRPMGCVMACGTLGLVAGLVVFSAPAIHQAMEAAVRFLP